MTSDITFHPIGYVRNDWPGPRYGDWGDIVSEIVVDEALASALDGIEQYSHIEVLFYIAGISAEQRQTLKLHPQNRQDAPLMGVFATHTQFRPNPIGVTVARLLGRQGNVLRVQGLDAYDGTPVLDIKNYAPDAEVAAGAVIPEWQKRIRQERK